ncbi:hypothetical protein, partial [Yersinia pestis]
ACQPARKTLAGSACRRSTPRLRRRVSPPVPDVPVVSGYEYRFVAAGRCYFCSGVNTCAAVGNSGHTGGVLADIAVLSAFLPGRYDCGRLP